MPGPPRILAIIAIATLLAGCAAAPKQAGVGPKPGPDIVAGSQGCDACAVVGDRVFFSFNSATLSKKAWATLIEQAKWLVKYPARSLLIAGNCNERDTEEYNLALGYRRGKRRPGFPDRQWHRREAHQGHQLRQGTPHRDRQQRAGMDVKPKYLNNPELDIPTNARSVGEA